MFLPGYFHLIFHLFICEPCLFAFLLPFVYFMSLYVKSCCVLLPLKVIIKLNWPCIQTNKQKNVLFSFPEVGKATETTVQPSPDPD